MRSFASYFLINITLLKGPTRLQDLGQTTVVLLGNEMERKGRQHCVKSAGIGFDPNTLGSILGKNRSIWFSNRRIIYTLYKGPTSADSYGPGVSEEIIAEALHPY